MFDGMTLEEVNAFLKARGLEPIGRTCKKENIFQKLKRKILKK